VAKPVTSFPVFLFSPWLVHLVCVRFVVLLWMVTFQLGVVPGFWCVYWGVCGHRKRLLMVVCGGVRPLKGCVNI